MDVLALIDAEARRLPVEVDLIDQAVNGVVSVTLTSAGTSGSPNTLDISSGAASNGRNKFIEFTDGGDLGATAYVQLTPNDAEKVVVVPQVPDCSPVAIFSIPRLVVYVLGI